MVAVVRSKPGPRRPHKVTSEVVAVLDEGVAAGLGCRRLRRLVDERTGVALSESHVGCLVRAGTRSRPAPEQIEIEAEVEPTTKTIEIGDRADDGPTVDAPVVLPERSRGENSSPRHERTWPAL